MTKFQEQLFEAPRPTLDAQQTYAIYHTIYAVDFTRFEDVLETLQPSANVKIVKSTAEVKVYWIQGGKADILKISDFR